MKDCPQGFQEKRNDSTVLFYRTDFNEETGFPSISAEILIDEHLHVKLQCNGLPIPLTKWFTAGLSAKLNRVFMLEKFIIICCKHTPFFHLRRASSKTARQAKWSSVLFFRTNQIFASAAIYNSYIHPLKHIACCKRSFHCLHSHYCQSYTEKELIALKVATNLLQYCTMSSDIILLCDEMFLQKSTQKTYINGE